MATSRRTPVRTTVTMHDVARLAKVSQSTVSRVLSGATDPIPIGEETRQRVLDAVQQLGYHPNLHAGSLRGQKTRMLAVMIADIANPFYHPMVRAIQDVANSHRYDVLVANSDHLRASEIHFIESVIRRPVDGVVMVPYHMGNDDLEELIVRTGAVIGVVGQHISHPQVDVAFGDDGRATEETVSWLIHTRCHTRIGFVGVTDNHSAAMRRRKAYEHALENAGLALHPGYEQLGDWSPESGHAAMQRLLALEEPPTATFVCNDLMAIGAMEAVREAGRRIPEEMAVIGFDDIPAASWVRPRLSTVAQYPEEMGRRLAESLFERIEGDYDGPARRLEVPCRFVQRESA